MSRLSMDLKVMPRPQKGHGYILCIIDEVTNYLVTAPLFQARSEEVGEALIENIITKYGAPECMIMDQDSAFMSSLLNYLFKALGIKIKTVLQPHVLTSETWHKVIISHFNKTSNRTRTNVAQIPLIGNVCL